MPKDNNLNKALQSTRNIPENGVFGFGHVRGHSQVKGQIHYMCLWIIGRRDWTINSSLLKLSSNASK